MALGLQDVNPIYIFLELATEMQRSALDEAANDARAGAACRDSGGHAAR